MEYMVLQNIEINETWKILLHSENDRQILVKFNTCTRYTICACLTSEKRNHNIILFKR